MPQHQNFSFIAALCLLPCASFAQQLGTVQKFDIRTTVKMDRYGSPWAEDGLGHLRGYTSDDQTFWNPHIAAYVFPLDGSAAPTEEFWPARVKLEGEVSSTEIEEDATGYQEVVHFWNEKSGEVSLILQRFNRMDGKPEGPQVPIGTVPLDPKTYEGSRLFMYRWFSPDSTKILLYFDGIKSQGIKLAMCWVFDPEGEAIWQGTYRIPVQSLGAESSVMFNNAGQVVVEVKAIVLDEDNTREKKDGTIRAKVETNYRNKTSTTVYLLHGAQFLAWDGQLVNGAETTFIHVTPTPAGWSLLASTRKGKKQEGSNQWVLGQFDGEFKPVITATGPLDAPLSKVLYTDATGFHALSAHGNVLAVSQIALDGTLGWRHAGPFPKAATLHDFRILADRLVYYHRWPKTDVESFQKGKGPVMDRGALAGIPTVLVWQDGKRTVTPLLPMDARGKDLPKEAGLYKEGLMMKFGSDKVANASFLPISWD